MNGCRYSRLALASCGLHVPWAASLGWCAWVIGTADGPVAGEIVLVPMMVWFWTGIPAGLCGLVAWVDIGASASTLRGRWVACIGMALAAVVPALGLAENVWGTIRQNRINREHRGLADPGRLSAFPLLAGRPCGLPDARPERRTGPIDSSVAAVMIERSRTAAALRVGEHAQRTAVVERAPPAREIAARPQEASGKRRAATAGSVVRR